MDSMFHTVRPSAHGVACFQLVEMRGVEPLSESIAMQLSPSASNILYFGASSPIGGLISPYLDGFPTRPPRIGPVVSCKCRSLSFSRNEEKER